MQCTLASDERNDGRRNEIESKSREEEDEEGEGFRLLFFSSHFGFKIFCCWGVLVVRNMVKNTFQSGFLSILYSFGYVLFFWSLFCLENKL